MTRLQNHGLAVNTFPRTQANRTERINRQTWVAGIATAFGLVLSVGTSMLNRWQSTSFPVRQPAVDSCYHISSASDDSALRRILGLARIPFFRDPKDRDSIRVGEAPAGYVRVTLSDPRPFPSVIVAWMPGLADAHVAAVLTEGCVWHPEARSTGWGVKIPDYARAEWNEAIASLRRDNLITTSAVSRALATMYMTFATGVLVRSEAARTRLEVFGDSSQIRALKVSQLRVHLKDGVWSVNGGWFQVALRSDGTVGYAGLNQSSTPIPGRRN
jgi:hypothetical protein